LVLYHLMAMDRIHSLLAASIMRAITFLQFLDLERAGSQN
jgi:hypothetical protein